MNDEGFVLAVLVVMAIVSAWLGSEITLRRGRGRNLGLVLGLVFGLLGVLAAFVVTMPHADKT